MIIPGKSNLQFLFFPLKKVINFLLRIKKINLTKIIEFYILS